MATGVLPIGVGQATRVLEYLAEAHKIYRAGIELGTATDTYDASGKVTFRGDFSGITREQVETALGTFVGSTQQTPPMYSALKHKGRPLYKLAREGIEIQRESRPVDIFRIDLLEWQPPFLRIEMECGKGTYVRSLAEDLGKKLGCGAHLSELVRSRYGPFDIVDAVGLPQLEEAVRNNDWQKLLYPPDYILRDMPSLTLDEEQAKAAVNGRLVEITAAQPQVTHGRAYTQDGRFIGILRLDAETGKWHAEKIFHNLTG
jgi:tRNA pseudouridine55 synthase